jgi:hypothetical protein
MRGEKITNIYVIDSVEYLYRDLNSYQTEYVNSLMNRSMYDEFRNKILFEEGDDLEGTIKIYFPSHQMECYDEYGVLLN